MRLVCGSEVGGSGEVVGTVVGSGSAVLLGGRAEVDGDGGSERVGGGPAVLVEFGLDMVNCRLYKSVRGLLYVLYILG